MPVSQAISYNLARLKAVQTGFYLWIIASVFRAYLEWSVMLQSPLYCAFPGYGHHD